MCTLFKSIDLASAFLTLLVTHSDFEVNVVKIGRCQGVEIVVVLVTGQS